MSAVDDLVGLLESANARVTFDRARNFTLPCVLCGEAEKPRTLVVVSTYEEPVGGNRVGEEKQRPVCAACVAKGAAPAAPAPRLVILVPGLRTVSESNAHEHHWMRVKRARAQHEAVTFALRARSVRCPFPPPLDVMLTRLSPGRLDVFGNLPGSLKHVVDACAKWFGIDDRHDHLVRYACGQEKTGRGVYGVRIVIEARVT